MNFIVVICSMCQLLMQELHKDHGVITHTMIMDINKMHLSLLEMELNMQAVFGLMMQCILIS
jgi:hypothetical protein